MYRWVHFAENSKKFLKPHCGCRDSPNFPNSLVFLVKLASEGLRVFYCRDFGFLIRSSIREVLGAPPQLEDWGNRPNQTIILREDMVYLDPKGYDISYSYSLFRIAGNSGDRQSRLGDVEVSGFSGFLVNWHPMDSA